MHFSVLFCCPLLLVAACAGTPVTDASAPAACTVQQVADIAVVAERAFVTAPATIEGKPVTMIVDTGSETTTVTPDAIMALRLARDPHASTTVIGVGGRITRRNVRVQSFGIGGLEVLDQSYAEAPLPSLSLLDFAASGVLGASWLSDYDVDLDLPHGRMAFYSVQGCTGDYLPWTGPRQALAARLFGRALVLLTVKLNGAPLTAMLDSGAAQSTISEAAAATADVDAAALARDPAGRATGADGNVSFVRDHRFDTLEVGDSVSRSVRVPVGRLHLAGGAQMLLGLDWLRRHRVWIGYATHQVFIAR